MNDLIKRQSAIDALDPGGLYISGEKNALTVTSFLNMVQKRIENLPGENAGWIPCSERLPKYDDWQLVTILDESGDTPYRYSDFGWYLEAAKCWVVGADQRTDIVAWMPLPEPWKGEPNG